MRLKPSSPQGRAWGATMGERTEALREALAAIHEFIGHTDLADEQAMIEALSLIRGCAGSELRLLHQRGQAPRLLHRSAVSN